MLYRFDTFTENAINPMTGAEYDNSWTILMLTDSREYQSLCGRHCGCAYTVKISRHNPNWKMAVGDFMDFYKKKSCILVMPEKDFDDAMEGYAGHAHNDAALRAYEPEFLVHSTPLASWDKIQKDGILKSWNVLKRENATDEETPIGMALGDPQDFRDYIMLGSGVSCEIVVNSKQCGRICMDANAKYLTGARLYFNARKMAGDKLLLRDGVHLKVKDTLPLEPYLLWAATWEKVGLKSRDSTPLEFSEKADTLFIEKERLQG